MSRQVRMVVRGLIDKITPLLGVDGSVPFQGGSDRPTSGRGSVMFFAIPLSPPPIELPHSSGRSSDFKWAVCAPKEAHIINTKAGGGYRWINNSARLRCNS